jgi:hypothetical protein
MITPLTDIYSPLDIINNMPIKAKNNPIGERNHGFTSVNSVFHVLNAKSRPDANSMKPANRVARPVKLRVIVLDMSK